MSVVLLRVGIDTGSGGIHGPLFEDESFEFIPIPDGRRHDLDKGDFDRTYGNTMGRQGRPFIEYFPPSTRARMSDEVMHVDPEFATFTYGDPTLPKRGLARLRAGDLLVFYAGLEGWGHAAPPALYIVGYFVVSQVGFAPQYTRAEIDELFAANAHVRDVEAFAQQYERLLLVKGGPGSRLLNRAVPISASGTNRAGKPLKVLSPEMRDVFGDFGGRVSIQRSPPRWVLPNYAERARAFVLSLA